MQYIPLASIPSQIVTVQLNGQNSQINVYQRFFGLYLDLYVNNVLIVAGCLCENLNRLVRSTYLGFQGDLGFWDTQGSSDPNYTGIGKRFQLVYLTPADLAALNVPSAGG